MTPEAEAEIKSSLAGIHKLLERVIATQVAHAAILETHTAQIGQVLAIQAVHSNQFAEVRGDIKAVNARLDEQRAWLQSMDLRFTAIMAPYQQRAAS
ncbi:MAG: hypothetical protein WCF85_04270 [Rhodospirillaceae bacterium]